jgi:hypothetical protein
VSVHDGRDLRELAAWTTPQRSPVLSVDVAPCTGFFVAGCANGIVAAFALPAFAVTVPVPLPEVSDGGDGAGGAGGSGSGGSGGAGGGGAQGGGAGLGAAALTATQAAADKAADAAKGVAKSAKAMLGSLFRR